MYYRGWFFVGYASNLYVVLLWCFQWEVVGLGALGDLMLYVVDMVYMLVGFIKCIIGNYEIFFLQCFFFILGEGIYFIISIDGLMGDVINEDYVGVLV